MTHHRSTAAWGFKSRLRHARRPTQKAHTPYTNPTEIHPCGVFSFPSAHQQHISEYQSDIFLRAEHILYMSDLPDDLCTMIDAWSCLPKAVQAGIVAMVKAAQPQ